MTPLDPLPRTAPVPPRDGVAKAGEARDASMFEAVMFALQVQRSPEATGQIAAAQAQGKPWQGASSDGQLSASLTADGYHLAVTAAGAKPIRIRLPNAPATDPAVASLADGAAPDPLSQALFGRDALVLGNYPPATLGGVALTNAQVARLGMGFGGGKVLVLPHSSDKLVLLSSDHWPLTRVPITVALQEADNGERSAELGMMLLGQGAAPGTGLRAFARMVEAAQQVGLQQIKATAIGTAVDRYNGYYTWPRYGFDAALRPGHIRQLPPSLAGRHTLLDLMSIAEGRTWWKANGMDMTVSFDLAPNSRSLQVLADVLREKGARIVP